MACLCTGITAGRSNSLTSGSILRTGKKHSSLCLCLWLNYDDISLSQHVLASSTVTYRTVQYCGGGHHPVIYGPWLTTLQGPPEFIPARRLAGWDGTITFFSSEGQASRRMVWSGKWQYDTGRYRTVLVRHGMTLPDSNHSIILISISVQGPHVVIGKEMRGQIIAN